MKCDITAAILLMLLTGAGCAQRPGQKAEQAKPTPADSPAQPSQQAPPRDQPVLVGATQFKYTVGDETGNALAYGVLIIPWPIFDGGSFRGTWQSRPVLLPVTDKLADPPKIGPQLGGGQLAGSRQGNTLRLSLNPNMNDNNVTLIGDVNGDEFRGTWEWSTFAGVSAKGKFAATRAE